MIDKLHLIKINIEAIRKIMLETNKYLDQIQSIKDKIKEDKDSLFPKINLDQYIGMNLPNIEELEKEDVFLKYMSTNFLEYTKDINNTLIYFIERIYFKYLKDE